MNSNFPHKLLEFFILMSFQLIYAVLSQAQSTTVTPVLCKLPEVRYGHLISVLSGDRLKAGETVSNGTVVALYCSKTRSTLSGNDGGWDRIFCEEDGSVDGSRASFTERCPKAGTTRARTGPTTTRRVRTTTTRAPSKMLNLPCSDDYMFRCDNGRNISCSRICANDGVIGYYLPGSDENICTRSMITQNWLDRNLCAAAWNGSLLLVRSLLDRRANIEARTTQGWIALCLPDDDGLTALQIAAWRGDLEMVRLFLDRGANIEAKRKDGDTPLLLARGSQVERLLIFRGANVNATSTHRWTALISAAYRNDSETVKLLVERGVDMDVATNCSDCSACKFSTALMCAAEKGHRSIVEYLIQSGATLKGCTHPLCVQ